ncbi:MAG: hypothetical protein JW969_04995 [Spirochaetales bacterium]|nr:hypothetical protein [Spirochaetales bacterium]
MSENTGFIILRDIPKEEVQLNRHIFKVKGGFRGFSLVPPGANYIRIKNVEENVSFWCYVPRNDAVVRVFDYEENEFKKDTEENETQFKQLAAGGTMGGALVPYSDGETWAKLTSHIREKGFPPSLHQEIPMEAPASLSEAEHADWMENRFKSRFEQAFEDSHKGDEDSFLEELQMSFAMSTVNTGDAAAFKRYSHLVQSIYNKGSLLVESYPGLLKKIADTFLVQFATLPSDFFTGDSFIVRNSNYLYDDMMEADDKSIAEKGKELRDIMKSRKKS